MPWTRCIATFLVLSICALLGLANLSLADDDAPADDAPVAEQPAAEGEAAEEAEMTIDEAKAKVGLVYTQGPATFELGPMAQIELPEGYQALNGDDTRKLLQLYGNLVGAKEVGCVEPVSGDWFVVFEFDEVGYVKDDEKDELDAAAMLKSMQKGQEAGNAERKNRGYDELELVGWEMEPNYNPQTHNLQWAIRIRNKSNGGESVNHFTRLLGRRGVMEVALVCDPDQLTSVLPDFEKLLTGFGFKSGEDYASFSSGDKVAEYGLAALVTGGAAAVAFKTGLIGKLGILIAKGGKLLIIGVLGILAFLGRLLGIGKKSSS